MEAGAGGRQRLALPADQDRLAVLLSVVANRRVAIVGLLHHVEAASNHWQRGDKALANLRLVFAGLPKPADRAAVDRLSLAEEVLDGGMTPTALMKALWPDKADGLQKYNLDEPRIAPGNGRRSGEWDFGGGDGPSSSSAGRDGRIVVAMEPDGHDAEDEKFDELRFLEGVETIEEGIAHGHPIRLPSGGGVGVGPFAGRAIPACPSKKPSSIQQKQINEIGRETGCHTCGTKDPGQSSGNFVCDHQPPTALCSDGASQEYLPHCISCSRRQGGFVNSIKNSRGSRP